jgi:hypothetical protein
VNPSDSQQDKDIAPRRLSSVPTDPSPSVADPSAEQRRALFRVVRGEPDDAELAALTALLAAAASSPPAAGPDGPRSVWNDRHTMVRRPLHPGPGAWRTSTWPR